MPGSLLNPAFTTLKDLKVWSSAEIRQSENEREREAVRQDDNGMGTGLACVRRETMKMGKWCKERRRERLLTLVFCWLSLLGELVGSISALCRKERAEVVGEGLGAKSRRKHARHSRCPASGQRIKLEILSLTLRDALSTHARESRSLFFVVLRVLVLLPKRAADVAWSFVFPSSLLLPGSFWCQTKRSENKERKR